MYLCDSCRKRLGGKITDSRDYKVCDECKIETLCFFYLDEEVKVTVYVSTDKETMYEIGERIGLNNDAGREFSYGLSEVALTLKVKTKTGDYEITHLDGRKIAPEK